MGTATNSDCGVGGRESTVVVVIAIIEGDGNVMKGPKVILLIDE